MRALVLSILFAAALSAAAQKPDPQAAASPAGANWQHVQVLPLGASVYVSTKTRRTKCMLKSVDAETLTCVRGKETVFQRTEIKSIQLPHRGRSTLAAAGIGIGVGAIVGAATGSSCSAAQKASFFGCFLIFTRGQTAVLGGTLFGVIATPIGFFTDFSRSTVYEAP